MQKPSPARSTVRRTAFALGVTTALALPLAASVAAQQPAETSPRLTCTGPFSAEASHASIVAIVGKDNAIFELVDGAEGEKVASTVLFPKNDKRRLELMWADEQKRRGLVHVRLSDTSTWVAPNGLKIGMTLAEVEKHNGKPFTLSGFDWDYGGYVTDWKGGAFGAAIPGGCTVQVRFTVPDGAPEGPASKVSGDREFASTDKNMRAVKPVIGTLSFGFPQP
jgi:hypothetical protein